MSVKLITHITHVRNIRMKNICDKQTSTNINYIEGALKVKTLSLTKYGLLIKEKICSLWEQIFSFKSRLYFGSDTR